jgi:hypothetical protein
VGYIGYAGSLLLQSDFPVEIAGHLGKLSYHRFDLRDAAAGFVDLKAPETRQCIPRLHCFNSKTRALLQRRIRKKMPDFSTTACSNAIGMARRAQGPVRTPLCQSKVAHSLPALKCGQSFLAAASMHSSAVLRLGTRKTARVLALAQICIGFLHKFSDRKLSFVAQACVARIKLSRRKNESAGDRGAAAGSDPDFGGMFLLTNAR